MSCIRFLELNVELSTSEREFGTEIEFIDGLNIIRAENTKGKSSVLNSILYALGMEELLGGKNSKTMKPVLKDKVKLEDDTELNVLESRVRLKVMNKKGEVITVTRWVKSNNKDDRLIRVEFNNTPLLSRDYYVHMAGSASEEGGFHNFLIDFLEIELPEVSTYSGTEVPLYLQTVFPYFFVEQKKGWSGFYYPVSGGFGIRNVSKRAFEYLLKMDILNSKKKKEELKFKKHYLLNKWTMLSSSLNKLSEKVNGYVTNLSETPSLLDNIKFYVHDTKGNPIELREKIKYLRTQIKKVQAPELKSIGEISEKHEGELKECELELLVIQGELEFARQELTLERNNLFSMSETIGSLVNDLKHNIEANKLYNLGAEIITSDIQNVCPVCSQHYENTLMTSEGLLTLSITDNISFIKEQINTLKFGIKQSKNLIETKTRKVKRIEAVVHDYRNKIQLLKYELSSNPLSTSQKDIEELIELKILYKSLVEIDNEFEELKLEVEKDIVEWKNYLEEYNGLPKEYFSQLDKEKLNYFEFTFIDLLKRFGFSSVDTSTINISREKYIPQIYDFDIKFDASASDNIRLIWSYAIAIVLTSNKFKGNHLGFLVFDEPGQQQMSVESQKKLFTILKKINTQSIVGTSVGTSDILSFIEEDSLIDKVKMNEFHNQYLIRPRKDS